MASILRKEGQEDGFVTRRMDMSKEASSTEGGFHSDAQKKKTPWPLVCKRTIPTVRPPLVDEI
jgi:hypothetical protein